jgi:hypothetical protein
MGSSSELKPEEAEEDSIPLVAPESAGRHGFDRPAPLAHGIDPLSNGARRGT